jgi:hypothetical protein
MTATQPAAGPVTSGAAAPALELAVLATLTDREKQALAALLRKLVVAIEAERAEG